MQWVYDINKGFQLLIALTRLPIINNRDTDVCMHDYECCSCYSSDTVDKTTATSQENTWFNLIKSYQISY